MADKIYLLRGNDTPMAVCLRKREGDGDPVPYDLSEAERVRLALVGHGMHIFAKDTEVSGSDHNIVSGVIPGRSLLPGDYDLEVTFNLDGRDKRFAIEAMFVAVDFLAEDADNEAEGEGDGIELTVTVQPEEIEIAGPTGPQGPIGPQGPMGPQGPVGPAAEVNEDDLDFNADDKLQLADRVYDSSTPDGLGYVILRKNKTFAQQVTATNTVYEIRYDFDLNAASVTVPAGCVLKFNGGSVVNGTIVGNKTIIDSETVKIFGKNTTLSGTFKNGRIYTEWFGGVADGATDNYAVFQKVFNQSIAIDIPIQLLAGTYIIDECPSDGDRQTLNIYFTADGQQFRMFGMGKNATEIKSADGWLDRLYSKHDSGSASDNDILRQKKLIYYYRNNNHVAELIQISGICFNRNGFSNTVQPSSAYAWEGQSIISSASASGYTGTCKNFVYTDLYIKNRTSSGIGFGNATCDSVLIKDVISDRRRYFAGVREELYPLAKCLNIVVEDCDVSFIHIEPISSQPGPRKATIRNCVVNTLEWNDSGFDTCSLSVENCVFNDTNLNISGVKSGLRDCVFNFTHAAESQVASGDSYLKGHMEVDNCKFDFTPDENGKCNVLYIQNTSSSESRIVFNKCLFRANKDVMHSHVISGGYQYQSATADANATAIFDDCVFYSNTGVTSKDGSVAAGQGYLLNCIRGLKATLNDCVLFRTGSNWVFKAGNATSGYGSLVLNNLKVIGDSGYSNVVLGYVTTGVSVPFVLDIRGEYGFVQMIQPYNAGANYQVVTKTKDFILVTDDPADILSITYKTYIPGTKIKVGNLLYTYNRDYINRTDLNINDFLVELINKNITTAERLAINTTYLPANSSVECFDTDLGRGMLWNGSSWVDTSSVPVENTQPSGGMAPNTVYNLGELAGDTTFTLAAATDNTIVNHYYWIFDTSSTVPSDPWPTGLTWVGGSAPTLAANKHYEISVINGVAAYMEV